MPAPHGYAAHAPGHAGSPVGYTSRRVGKVRNPFAVWVLSLITFGFYMLYWWYSVNREVKEYDPNIQVEPVLSLFALFIPIVNLVSIVKTGTRINRAQRSSGSASCSGGLGLLLAFLFSFHLVYYQSALNEIWRRHGDLPAGTAV